MRLIIKDLCDDTYLCEKQLGSYYWNKDKHHFHVRAFHDLQNVRRYTKLVVKTRKEANIPARFGILNEADYSLVEIIE